MTVDLQVRLVRLDALARARPVLAALAAGRCLPEARGLADEASARLGEPGYEPHYHRDHLVESLGVIRSPENADVVRKRSESLAHALLEALVFVEPLGTGHHAHDRVDVDTLMLGDGSDGYLYSEFMTVFRFFERLVTEGGERLIPPAPPDDDELEDPAFMIATPGELAELRGGLETLARDRSFLVKTSWERVDPARARIAFERLRRMVLVASEVPDLAFGWEWRL